MALQQRYEKKVYGQIMTFENAYYQIAFLSIVPKEKVNIQINIYNDSNKQYLIEQSLAYEFTPSDDVSPNYQNEGYKYMKTLDEFKDAIDILEVGQVT